jgi:hypothetical protein
MKITSKIAIGPMSEEAIEAACMFSKAEKMQLMLISSKSQIDWSGGYVGAWTTERYADYVRKMQYSCNADIVLCRDHCGPGFKGGDDVADTYRTVDADIAAGYDLIHVDFCHWEGDHASKLQESKKMIEYVAKLDPDMLFEVGTDENVGSAEMDLGRIGNDIDFFKSFCSPEFYVVQTGSLIKEVNQVGTYNEDVVREISELLHGKGLKLKEHNADYLHYDELVMRRNKVDAVNIAPMLGVLQTSLLLHKSLLHGFDATDFLNRSYESGKWKKWLYRNDSNNKYLCALTAGHYVFTSDEYLRLYDLIDKAEGGFRKAIVEAHSKVIHNYTIGLA